MSDSLQSAASTPDPVGALADDALAGELTPAEIDARHARQLVERALSQLERGERNAAELAVRQAIHLAPGVAAAHSLAGLLAFLEGNVAVARIGYENAVTDFSKASPERERLIALRMAQADGSQVEASAFVPNLPAEIARLRAIVAATSPQDFLSDGHTPNSAQPRMAYPSEVVNATAAPSPAVAPPMENNVVTRPAFASRLERRKRTSAWAVGIAAVSAAIVAFLVMRSLTAPRPAPPAGSTPGADQVTAETAPATGIGVENSASETTIPETAALGDSASTPAAAAAPASNASEAGSTPAPDAVVTVKPLPPVSTAPTATPRPAAKPKPKPKTSPEPSTAAPTIPGLPTPAPERPAAPRETPRPSSPAQAPRETPRDPNFPPMPPPKITLPSAGGEKPEFPRVIPDND
jgi:hypothetical protein